VGAGACLVARSVRGIEELVAAEIGRRGLGEVVATGHREVRFVARPAPGVTALATADDVFVLVAEVDGIGRARADLARLAAAVAAADLAGPLAVRAGCGGPPGAAVDVSASLLGRRAFNRYDVEDAVGAVLAARLGAPYRSRRDGRPPEGGTGWRVALVGDRAAVSVRIGARPLHRRPWKVASVPGTLHPPLAAAMVALSGVRVGEAVLDPCCGAGTPAVEAARAGARVLGVDHDPAALAAAARNGRGRGIGWVRADAGALPLAAGSVSRVLLNPPWGRRVAPAGLLGRRPELLGREVRRVLAPGGTAVVLVPDGADPVLPGLRVERRLPVALAGSRLVLLVLR
jgi:tRNA (guanine6-N2)-methyltransferase